MANNIYINTQLKDLTANAVANLNRPTQVVRLPQIIEGEIVDVVLHLVNSNGQYDARSGTAVDVAVAISAKGKSATSGTFKLNAGIESTSALAWNASAEAVAGALNALNGGSGAYGSKVSVQKLANGSYRVIFDDVGARVDMAGQSLDLAPESEVTVGTSVVGSPTIRAQQVIEISQQPAIYSEEWASVGSTWTGQLDANTARVQELIAEGADAFFEIKVGTDVVCQVPISVFPAVAAPNSLPAHSLPNNLDAFAADPTTNGFFNPANWREDLSLVVGEDVQAWSTNLDEVAAKMEWNNQELTFDIITGSSNVVIQVGQETLMYCRNKTGADIIDGQVVKIVGAQGNTPNIDLALASNAEEAHRTIGVATQTILGNNGTGFITLVGKVRGLDLRQLNGFTEGGLVYLSDTVAGALTPVKPAIEVEIGHVLRLGQNNGTLGVFINNEASVYELKQELSEQITENYNEIELNRNSITSLNNRVDELYPVYPYTTSIAGGIGSIKNLRDADLNSGYRLNTAITSVTLGSNCKSLGSQTFQGCNSLVEFYYHNSTAGTIGDMCFENCIKYGQGINAGGNGFTLGRNITAIGNSSYRGCTSLKTVRLSDYDLAAVGRFAFEGGTALEEFTFPQQIGDSQNIFTVVSESVLRNCTALTQIEIPRTVTQIQAAAFRDCTALSSIRCYATEAPTLVGINQFLNVNTTTINVPVNSTGYSTTYAGLTVNYIL